MSRLDGSWLARALARRLHIRSNCVVILMDAKIEQVLRTEWRGYRWFVTVQSALMKLLCVASTAIILLILAFIVIYLLTKGVRHLNWDIFTEVPIPQGMQGAPGGLKNALVGTMILIGLASVIGIPLGVLAAIYLSEYSARSWLAGPARFIADVLTGVPSIVVGILGYELVVVPMGSFSGYAGAAALAFIMIPIVARTTEEMLRLVPNSYRDASIALGATKARTIVAVVLPAAGGSIITGIMLAIARVAGETAPLLFTALGSRLLTLNPSQPFPSLTVQVFTYATGPYRDEQNLAWAGLLILIGIVFALNMVLRLTVYHLQRSRRTAE
jgi:phosphate transport system permease protein